MLLNVIQLEPEIGDLIIKSCNSRTTIHLNSTCRRLRMLTKDRARSCYIDYTMQIIPIRFRRMHLRHKVALDYMEKSEAFATKTTQSQARRNYLNVRKEMKTDAEAIAKDFNEENYQWQLKNMIHASFSTLCTKEWCKTVCAGTHTKRAIMIYDHLSKNDSIPDKLAYEITNPKKTHLDINVLFSTDLKKTFLTNLITYLSDIKSYGIVDRFYLDDVYANMQIAV